MAKGAFGQYVIRDIDIRNFLQGYERALADSGFMVKNAIPQGQVLKHKAVWGGKAKAWLVGQLPFGKLFKSGKRLGAEAEIYQHGGDVVLKVLVVPYMELFDRAEVFLLSQGILEKITDDSFSRDKLNEIMSRLVSLGYKFQQPLTR